eukprot:5961689-Amphidinium_carterae.1
MIWEACPPLETKEEGLATRCLCFSVYPSSTKLFKQLYRMQLHVPHCAPSTLHGLALQDIVLEKGAYSTDHSWQTTDASASTSLLLYCVKSPNCLQQLLHWTSLAFPSYTVAFGPIGTKQLRLLCAQHLLPRYSCDRNDYNCNSQGINIVIVIAMFS